ncbi:MAG: efflux RND transporter periplasmic adaptor subunit [Hyphomicrobiales bacterium]
MSLKKRLILAFAAVAVLVVILGGIKGLQIDRMIAHGRQMVPPPEAVTTAVASLQSWESLLTAVGSLAAVQGVTVTAELTGKVVQIAFTPGTMVKAGDLLVKQDTSSEEAQLRSAEAAAALAKLNVERLGKLLVERTIAQSQFDNAEATYKQAIAQADNIRASIAKKTIRAPFSGRLGIRLVNLGQVLNEGEAIVSLQSLDPIYVDFSLPQQQLPKLQTGFAVRVTTDALPGEVVKGNITAINPQVDAATRNIRIQATVANPQEHLRPGMYVNVAVVLPEREKVLAIPATAVLYAPYSDSVFIVEDNPDPASGGTVKVVRQQFTQLGEKHGDFVAVRSGLKEGDVVVSTGVFKLRNGQTVSVDNSLSPDFKLKPNPAED